ncbi:hypothetical protein FJZ26_00075 [Candidatus Parvarchaeota archaeon]|nr:hypothetical protein [Candidatus Parvarchaeota archaeon]
MSNPLFIGAMPSTAKTIKQQTTVSGKVRPEKTINTLAATASSCKPDSEYNLPVSFSRQEVGFIRNYKFNELLCPKLSGVLAALGEVIELCSKADSQLLANDINLKIGALDRSVQSLLELIHAMDIYGNPLSYPQDDKDGFHGVISKLRGILPSTGMRIDGKDFDKKQGKEKSESVALTCQLAQSWSENLMAFSTAISEAGNGT